MSSTIITTSLPVPNPLVPAVRPVPQHHSRTRHGRRKHAMFATLTSIVSLCVLAVVAFHGYIAWMLAHPYVAPLYSNPTEAVGLPYENVNFPSHSNRTTVGGWFIPSGADGDSSSAVAQTAAAAAEPAVESGRTVIFSHGYGANREETWVPMYDLATLLHRLNYNVFMFDYGYASTDYKAPATGGYEESQQLLAAVDYVKSRGADEIVVWGFSMGAGTALQAGLQTDKIDAMILDSLFLPSPDTLFHNVKQILPLPKYPSLPLIELMLPAFTGTSLSGIPAKQVLTKDYPIPLFIMHGTKDSKAPYEIAEHIAAKQTNPLSREWIVEGGKHELLFQVHAKEYIQRAALFLGQVHQQHVDDASSIVL
ncbi:alpha/beta hydrolase [Paenibacillus sp. MMS18-CY102]|uniref:alpha/beta hydrolase n=1 Tax=Paenibacillus sp. MMS18-CY102 TaxID=2682849 RepID=UPI0013654071|nr:alpha/beta fold hydrolase [Paenibacillus sp. MMS18-CY102]MWC29945.1 alpha/beta fold hydrolase [Paenibacillus sp. MMS18-CY102]